MTYKNGQVIKIEHDIGGKKTSKFFDLSDISRGCDSFFRNCGLRSVTMRDQIHNSIRQHNAEKSKK